MLKFVSRLFLILVLVVVWLQATNDVWKYHLRSDTDGFYYSRANYFLEKGNLTDLGYNEYQPGAVMFFVSLAPVLLVKNSTAVYSWTVVGVNMIFVVGLFWLLEKKSGVYASLGFLLIVLFSGPIVLFRFEFFVMTIVLMSVYLFKKKSRWLSCFVLGMATAVKIFPVLLIPYYLIVSGKKGGVKEVVKNGVGYLLGGMVVVGLYLVMFQVKPPQVLEDMGIHARKPIHAESVWGSGLTVYSKLVSGEYAKGKGDLGIYGIDPKYVLGPKWFYNYFWLYPMGLFYLVVIMKELRSKKSRLDVRVMILVLMIFLSFSKILTSQYLLWFGLLYPLLVPKISDKKRFEKWIWGLFFLVLMMGLSQAVYPLGYNQLLGLFFAQGKGEGIFWVLFGRNLLLVGGLVWLMYDYVLVKDSRSR